MIRNKVDVSDFKSKVDISYPCIRVVDPFPTFPLVYSSLDKGDVGCLLTFNGETKQIGKVSLSVYNVKRLLLCCGPFEYHKNANDVVVIDNVLKYVEMFQDGFSD